MATTTYTSYRLKDLIAIAFSDLHLHEWKSFNKDIDRLDIQFLALKQIADKAFKHKVPLLFLGDLIHNPKYITNRLFSKLLINYKFLIEDRDIYFYAISGNHDQSEKNTREHHSPSYSIGLSHVFKTFHCMDWANTFSWADSIKLYGLPFISNNRDFELPEIDSNRWFNILMIHTDLYGAKDTDGRIVNITENIPKKMGKYFKQFDLVLCGHIHRPQKIGKHIYMIGAPQQQDRGDEGCDMGYWKIYKNKPPVFKKLHMPEFLSLVEGTPLPDDFNYYTHVPKEEIVKDIKKKKFNNKVSKFKLARRYCKVTGIQDKVKIDYLVSLLKRIDD